MLSKHICENTGIFILAEINHYHFEKERGHSACAFSVQIGCNFKAFPGNTFVSAHKRECSIKNNFQFSMTLQQHTDSVIKKKEMEERRNDNVQKVLSAKNSLIQILHIL